tara:strand:+ start:246 stop:692 length:447 start_codon:yes stop_codon:yes gene_type:complete
MLNIYYNLETGSVAIWPITSSMTSSNFSLELTNDMNQVSQSFNVYRKNTPNNLSEYLELEYYTGSNVPTASGQYTYNLKSDGLTGQVTWGGANQTFLATQFRWSDQFTTTGSTQTVDSGRAFVFGTNDPNYTKYTTANENGAYITYYT